MERDALGRILTETVNGRTTRYTYDALGRRTGRQTPSGMVSRWTYDPVGRPISLESGNGELRFVHDAVGREVQRRIGKAVALTQTWDRGDRLTTQSLAVHVSAGTERLLQHRAYAYQAAGHVTEIRELTSGTRRFDVDTMGRVTGVRAHGWAETYAYDVVGNVVHVAAPHHDASGDREFKGTLIRRSGRTEYEYDAQGRLVRRTRRLLNGQKRQWTYSWNAEDRLTDAITPEGEHWRYAYDAIGRRTAKYRTDGSGTAGERTEWCWDGSQVAEQSTADGRVKTWEYAPGTHRPVAQIDHRPAVRHPGTSFFARLAEEATADPDRTARFHAVITDLVGTPTELVSVDGDVAWQRRTTLWGNAYPAPTDDSESVDCPIRFPGQYWDAETGLHHNFHRYYDPETARYISPDPLGLDAGPNPCWYGPNPLTWIDPHGLAACRTSPRMENGNPKEGWQHIDERHIAGTASGGHGDLMPPSTTRAQVEKAAQTMIDKGTRVSDPARRMQTFEKRMVVNGMRARYRLVVDSEDGNRIITFFPVGKSYTP